MTDTTREAVNLTGLDDYLRDPSVGLPWDIRIRIADALRLQQAEIARLTVELDAALAQVPEVVIHHLRTILDEAEHHLPGSVAQNNIIYAANKAPADATAALDRIKRQARAEGMRKAAEMLRSRNVGMHPVYVKATGEDADAILAAADREERGDE